MDEQPTDTPQTRTAYQPMINDMPLGERPRERLRFYGAGALSSAELLAILLRVGVRGVSAVNLAIVESPQDRPRIGSPADAANLVLAEMGLLEQEQLRLMLLDTKNHVLKVPTVYVGNLNTSLIRVGELFRHALRTNNCAGMIVVHNHPSGDPTPSPEDIRVTERIVEAGELMNVEIMDHLIIGRRRFVSLKERRLGFH
jgi:DNA repair protein RadC